MDQLESLNASIFATGLQLVSRAWRARTDAALAELGVSTTQAFPISAVHRLGGGVRQHALAAALGIEGPSLVRTLDKLGAAGLLERRDDSADRRAKTLHLTEDGAKLARAIETVVANVRNELLAGVEAEDLAAAVRVLQTVARTTGVVITPIGLDDPEAAVGA